MNRDLSIAVGLCLATGILTCWVQDRWAIACFHAAIFAICGIWLLQAAKRLRPITFDAILLVPLAAILIGVIQLSLGLTVSRWDTILAIEIWAGRLAVMFLALQFGQSRRVREGWLAAMTAFAVVIASISIVQYFSSRGAVFWLFPSGSSDALLGPFRYHNKYAQFVELFLPILLLRAFDRSKHMPTAVVAAAILIAGTVAGGSRSGFVIAVIETIAVIVWIAAKGIADQRRALLTGLKAFSLLLIAGAVVCWDYLDGRFRMDPLQDDRLPLMRSSVDMMWSRPILGFGLGTWAKAYPEFALFDDGLFTNQAHCDWLQWPGEGGLTLLAAMLFLAGVSLRNALAYPWSAGVFFVFLHGLADYPLQQVPQFAALVLTVLALGVAQRKSEQVAIPPLAHAGARIGKEMR